MGKDKRISFIRSVSEAEMADILWFREHEASRTCDPGYRIRKPFNGDTEQWDLAPSQERKRWYDNRAAALREQLGAKCVVSTLVLYMYPYGCVRLLCLETEHEVLLPGYTPATDVNLDKSVLGRICGEFALNIHNRMTEAGQFTMQDNLMGDSCALCSKDFEDAQPLIVYINVVGAKRAACLTCAHNLDGTSARVETKAVYIIPPEPCVKK